MLASLTLICSLHSIGPAFDPSTLPCSCVKKHWACGERSTEKYWPFEATIDMVVHTSFFLGCLLSVFLLALISLFGQLKRFVLIGRPLILFWRFNEHMVKKGINGFTNVDYKSKGLSNEALLWRCKCCPPPPQGQGEGRCLCGSSAARSEDCCVQPAAKWK